MLAAGTLEPDLGIDTCASDELSVIAQTADTSLYQQLVTFLNAKARGICSNQSDNRNGSALHKVQSDEVNTSGHKFNLQQLSRRIL